VALLFVGADTGAWPSGTTTNVAINVLKFDNLDFKGGEETKDFSGGMEAMKKMRFVKQATELEFDIKLEHPSRLMAKYLKEGPLCQFITTQANQTDADDVQQWLIQGRMALPDVKLLVDAGPGVIHGKVEAYGRVPMLVVPTDAYTDDYGNSFTGLADPSFDDARIATHGT
jgi:hypothetical protein